MKNFTNRINLNTSNRRRDVQWLRGFSVLAIVLFHIGPHVFPNGYLGVNIFFVISGFVVGPIIAKIISEKNGIKNSLVEFYFRRFFRLAPAFSIILSFSLLGCFLLGPIYDHDRISGLALTSIGLIGNLGAYKFANNYFHPNENPLIHLWSLSAEEQIYIIVPVSIIFFNLFTKNNERKVRTFYLLVGFASIITQFLLLKNAQLLNKIGVQDVPGLIYYLPISHLWEFSAGALLATHKPKLPVLLARPLGYIFFGFGLILVFSIIDFGSLGPILSLVWALIFLMTNPVEKSNGKIGIWIGNRSYSIYLLHLPLLYIFKVSWIFVNFPEYLRILFAILLTILISDLSYKRIESRFRVKSGVQTTLTRKNLELIGFFTELPLGAALFLISFGGQSFVEDKKNYPQRAWEADKQCDALSLQLCKYTSPNSAGKALLIGDSHAGAISQVFINSALNNNYSAETFMWRGCPVISKNNEKNIISRDRGLLELLFVRVTPPEYCSQNVARAEKIIESGKYDYIFLTNNCAYCTISELEANANTAKDFSKFALKVVIVGQTPVFDKSVRFGPSAFMSFSTKNPVSVTHIPITASRQDRFYKEYLNDSNVGYVPTYPLYCNLNQCITSLNNQYLYLDNNHLSLEGSKLLTDSISNIFKDTKSNK